MVFLRFLSRKPEHDGSVLAGDSAGNLASLDPATILGEADRSEVRPAAATNKAHTPEHSKNEKTLPPK